MRHRACAPRRWVKRAPCRRPSSSCRSTSFRSFRGCRIATTTPTPTRSSWIREPFGRVRVHVASYGRRDAPPLLLVHGLMTSSYSWRYLFERLGDSFRLIAPDFSGSGRSDRLPDRPHSPRALATFLGELQSELAITGCQAIGNSLGGYICMHRALLDPASFERLVVVHAPGIVQPRLVALHVALRVPGVAAALSHVDPPRPAALGAQERALLRRDAEVARGGARVRRPAGERRRRPLVHPRSRRRARPARDAGAGARARAPPRQRRRISDAADARLRARGSDGGAGGGGGAAAARARRAVAWLEHSSHFAQVDTPDRLLETIGDFLRLAPTARSSAR